MSERYVNAKEVFPKDMLLSMSKAVGGRAMRLYLPRYENLLIDQREKAVVSLRESGMTVARIAEQMFLSVRTVYRILRENRLEKEGG